MDSKLGNTGGHSRLWLPLFAGIVFVLVFLILFGYLAHRPKRSKGVTGTGISKWVSENEITLREHARVLLEGKLKQNPGKVTYAPPSLPPGEFSIIAATKDKNDNIYYIMSNSFVTFDRGIILQNGSRPFVGDQCEPRITFTRRLFGNWWYYEAD